MRCRGCWCNKNQIGRWIHFIAKAIINSATNFHVVISCMWACFTSRNITSLFEVKKRVGGNYFVNLNHTVLCDLRYRAETQQATKLATRSLTSHHLFITWSFRRLGSECGGIFVFVAYVLVCLEAGGISGLVGVYGFTRTGTGGFGVAFGVFVGGVGGRLDVTWRRGALWT